MLIKNFGLTAIAIFLMSLVTNQGFVQNPQFFKFNSPVLAEAADSRKATADKLLYQGIEQYQTNRFAAAIQSWQQALAIYQELKNRQGEGESLGYLGATFILVGDYNKALEYLQPFLIYTREIADRKREGQALGNLGIAYHAKADYTKAIEYHQQSLTLAKQIGDRQAEMLATGSLGTDYTDSGDYQKAIELHQQSLAIAQAINDRRNQALALGNLGTVHQLIGDYGKAIDYYQQTLAVIREIKYPQGEAQVLGNLGNTYQALGQYEKALNSFQEQLQIAQATKDRQGEGIAFKNLGTVYINLAENAKAVQYLEQSLLIAREIKNRDAEGNTLNNLGSVYQSLGQNDKAMAAYQQSLAIAQAINNRRMEVVASINLGNIYTNLSDFKQAVNYHQKSLAIAQSLGDSLGEGWALNNLAFAQFKEGKFPEAEKSLRKALEILESMRAKLKNDDAYKVSIFDTQAITYRWLQKVIIAQNKPDIALEIAERGRARAFLDLLSQRLSSQTANKSTNVALPTVSLIQNIARQQQATIIEYSIIPEESLFQGKLTGKAAEIYIWVVQPSGKIIFRRSDLKSLKTPLKDLVSTSRDSIGVRGFVVAKPVQETTPTEQLKQLHQILIQPIADLLPQDPNARVIFVPQESLFLVPFPALVDDSGKFLIEKHTILTTPAIQVLELTHQKLPNNGNREALVVGNPIMPIVAPAPGEAPQQLPSLPGAEAEAKAIAQILHTQPLIGNKATKEAVISQMAKARIIHLATHGLLDDFGDGIPGAIALAPDKNDNGLLTAGKILDLKLNAELVVLSACNTGKGTITGDGVIGLSRSLISAGVPSVIVSLWSVPDAPTSTLMTEFYRNWQQNSDKAKALRNAMLTTMKKYPNPRDWAAFTLVGEAD